jgi:hypothetical protein
MREGKRNFTLTTSGSSYRATRKITHRGHQERLDQIVESDLMVFPSFLHQVWTNRNRRKGLLLQSTDAKPTSFYFFEVVK